MILCMDQIQEYFSSTTSSTALDSSQLRRLLLECVHQRGQFDQHFDRERPFPSRLTQAGPTGWQADRAQCPSLTHVQAAVGTLALEQNAQLLALQRVEWMRYNQRTGKRPVRPRIMR